MPAPPVLLLPPAADLGRWGATEILRRHADALPDLSRVWVLLPGPAEAPQGGHAVMAVGYDYAAQRFVVRNSWGAGWGMRGYFTLPYAYLLQPGLTADLWAIELME